MRAVPPAPSARPSLARRWSTRPSASSPPRASTPPRSTRSRRRPATRRAPSTRTSRRRRTSSSRSTSAGSKPAWPSSTRSEAAPLARDAIEAMARTAPMRSERDDGWLAVFFEFWAHVLRHEELRGLRSPPRACHRAARDGDGEARGGGMAKRSPKIPASWPPPATRCSSAFSWSGSRSPTWWTRTWARAWSRTRSTEDRKMGYHRGFRLREGRPRSRALRT